MLAVLGYPRATATVKSSAQEVEGFARRHLVVCGSEGTFHIQPLDNPSARIALSKPRGKYKSGYQDVTFPKYTRYVADAADMARIIRGEKEADFSYEHDLTVQRTLAQACQMPLDNRDKSVDDQQRANERCSRSTTLITHEYRIRKEISHAASNDTTHDSCEQSTLGATVRGGHRIGPGTCIWQ